MKPVHAGLKNKSVPSCFLIITFLIISIFAKKNQPFMIKDFIHAAMPWVLGALAMAAVAVNAAAARRKAALQQQLTDEELAVLRKKKNERVATATALGLLVGVALGLLPGMDIPAGAGIGAVMGALCGIVWSSKIKGL